MNKTQIKYIAIFVIITYLSIILPLIYWAVFGMSESWGIVCLINFLCVFVVSSVSGLYVKEMYEQNL